MAYARSIRLYFCWSLQYCCRSLVPHALFPHGALRGSIRWRLSEQNRNTDYNLLNARAEPLILTRRRSCSVSIRPQSRVGPRQVSDSATPPENQRVGRLLSVTSNGVSL